MFITVRIRRPLAVILFVILLSIPAAIFLPRGVEAVYASLPAGDGKEVLILMYHNVIDSKYRTGEYTVTPDELERDIIYLKKAGYETVTMRELADYVHNGAPLPEKTVVLTFDDGYYNNYLYAFPILKKHDARGVIAVVGSFSEHYSESEDRSPIYSHVTWDMIREMNDSGLVEIANHSYMMHSLDGRKGSSRKKNESPEDYRRAFMEDTAKNQDILYENAGCTPITYVYPFGAVSRESIPILKEMGFLATLSCTGKKNYLTGDPDELHMLCRYIRPGGVKTEAFFKKLGI